MGHGLVLVVHRASVGEALILWGVQESVFPEKGRDFQNEKKEFEGEKGRGW